MDKYVKYYHGLPNCIWVKCGEEITHYAWSNNDKPQVLNGRIETADLECYLKWNKFEKVQTKCCTL